MFYARAACLVVGAASVVSAGPMALTVGVQSSQFQLGHGRAVFSVHGPYDRALRAEVLDADDRTVAEAQPIGDGLIQWDGRDSQGRLVHPGVYYMQIVEEPYLWDGAIVVQP